MTKSLQELYREARTSPEPYQDPTVLVEGGGGAERYDKLSGMIRKDTIRGLLQQAGVKNPLLDYVMDMIPDEPEGEKSALAADAALMKRFPTAGHIR